MVFYNGFVVLDGFVQVASMVVPVLKGRRSRPFVIRLLRLVVYGF